MKHPNWQPVTHTDAQPSADPCDRPKEYTLDHDTRHVANMASMDILANTRRAALTVFTPGLVVVELTEADLSEAERVAFGFA